MFARAGLRVEQNAQSVKRHNLLDWARRQGNDDDCHRAPRVPAAQRAAAGRALGRSARDIGSPAGSFIIRQLQLSGRK